MVAATRAANSRNRSMSTVPGSRKPHPAAKTHAPLRVLVTAGPTREPLDAVRYLANRSSGRMGMALALAAHRSGAAVTLLLGPIDPIPQEDVEKPDSGIAIERFESSHDLEASLGRLVPAHDCLFMAAAVADYRPESPASGKLRRTREPLTLQLVPVPDLLAAVAADRRDDQFLVGFALEAAHELDRSAREKLRRKNLDAIVANDLATMGAPSVAGRVYLADGRVLTPERAGPLPKQEFAVWLTALLLPLAERRREAAPSTLRAAPPASVPATPRDQGAA